jgi:head-tail adaptor
MKAGALRHVIQLERATVALDSYGAPQEAWQVIATLRAQKVSEAIVEQTGSTSGAVGVLRVVFKTRAFGGVTLADRVTFAGFVFDIKELGAVDFSEARGLLLTCEARQ